jgi:hypothetical protein
LSSLDSVSFENPIGCANCALNLYTASRRRSSFYIGINDSESRLQEVADRLLRRTSTCIVHYPSGNWICGRPREAWKARRLAKLSDYWNDLFHVNQNKSLTAQAAEDHERIYHHSNHVSTKVETTPLDQSEPNKKQDSYQTNRDLFAIYRSTRRRLQKWLGHHERCVKNAAGLATSYPGVRLVSGRVCPYSNMLLLWRMYWENVDHPYKLLPYRKRSRLFAPELRLPLIPVSFRLPRQFLTRIFLRECLAVLDECRLLSIGLNRKGFYSFNLAHLKFTRVPYWIIQKEGHNVFVLHTWKRAHHKAPLPLWFSKPLANTTMHPCDLSGLDLKREVTTGPPKRRGRPQRGAETQVNILSLLNRPGTAYEPEPPGLGKGEQKANESSVSFQSEA